MENRRGADPEKYARLSTPFESRDELALLREKYHIAELVCQLQVYIKTEDGVESMTGGSGWGDQMKQARLAKLRADREIDDALMMLCGLANASETIADQLITDPKGSELREKVD